MSQTKLQAGLCRGLRCSIVLVAFLLGGCGSVGYYYQSAKGQLDLMCRARDLGEVLEDQEVASAVRDKLRRVAAMRQFASEAL